MKRSWLLSISLVLALLAIVGLSGCSSDGINNTGVGELPSSLEVNLNTSQEGIWISGTGEVTVTPDIAILRLGIVEHEADGIQERDIAVITARLYLRLETN